MILSKRIHYEHFETQSQYSTDQGSQGDETGGYIRVNLQYCVRWGSSMGPSRLSRSASNKASEAWAPSDPAAQPGMRSSGRQGKGEGAGPGWDSSDSSIVISDEATDHDLIDHYHGNRSVSGCGSSPLELSVSQGKAVIGGKVTGQTERGVESDAESCCSVDSIASGPSFMVQATPLTPPPGLCLTCQRLHREAKRRGHTPLDTLTDDDPTSLSCDQWVLMKKWTPRRPQNVKGRLWIHLGRIRHREQTGGEQPACSRPHIFLQRNLRRYERQAVSRGRKRKKRSRGRRQRAGTCVQSNSLNRSGFHSSGLHSSGPDGEVQENGDDSRLARTRRVLTFQVSPSSVTMETLAQEEATPPQEEEPRKRSGGFRTLLAQLHGNRSRVVRETHT
ncbi:uncharacterized protein si:ch211-227n13.3 isoform X1 [Coregonus clupeaformis]|uniref:uncharacterized protein si:ch211-227n13.3 isoform X1 n=2 Tax=Coregonus clupeaformis TaxID=59861 RepID=UPI001E1C5254|nr:uncharacterized protein si:ch211-227n13.3 isoform X1 [Coregonus clupeaformis]